MSFISLYVFYFFEWFLVGGANRGFGSSFGSGGPPRGSGPSRGGRGSKDSVFNNGIQSGGRGGGPSNGSRGTVPNVGTAGQRGGQPPPKCCRLSLLILFLKCKCLRSLSLLMLTREQKVCGITCS